MPRVAVPGASAAEACRKLWGLRSAQFSRGSWFRVWGGQRSFMRGELVGASGLGFEV